MANVTSSTARGSVRLDASGRTVAVISRTDTEDLSSCEPLLRVDATQLLLAEAAASRARRAGHVGSQIHDPTRTNRDLTRSAALRTPLSSRFSRRS